MAQSIKSRPKWARKLPARLWRHLKESVEEGQRPTLRALKSNLAGQREGGFHCWDCEEVARLLGLEENPS